MTSLHETPGTKGTWVMPTVDPETQEPMDLEIHGKFLAFATTKRYRHTHEGAHVGPDDPRCSACRWTEFRLFRTDDGPYVVHYTGRSILPGETSRFHDTEVLTSPEVVEQMTTRKDGRAYLTATAARLLAQASAFDEPVRDAFENRAVL